MEEFYTLFYPKIPPHKRPAKNTYPLASSVDILRRILGGSFNLRSKSIFTDLLRRNNYSFLYFYGGFEDIKKISVKNMLIFNLSKSDLSKNYGANMNS